jgi:hypothetical protein
MNAFSLRMSTRILAPLCAAVLVAATACGDLTSGIPTLPTIADTTVVYSVNGAPPSAPTALYLFSGNVVPATTDFTFDIVFDVDTNGKVKLIPNPNFASALVGAAHPVALQVSTQDFDDITVAPTGGYHTDSVQVVSPGTTVLIQSQDALACQASLVGVTVYGKVVVDSLDKTTRRMFIRYVSDPNCGFRSLEPGLPKFIR